MKTKTITKSVRLSANESQQLVKLSQEMALSESQLMKRWIQQGIEVEKLEMAVRAYQQRQTDLRGGAAMADISYNRFLYEVQKRNIVVIDMGVEGESYLQHLGSLADHFDSKHLRQAVKHVVDNN